MRRKSTSTSTMHTMHITKLHNAHWMVWIHTQTRKVVILWNLECFENFSICEQFSWYECTKSWFHTLIECVCVRVSEWVKIEWFCGCWGYFKITYRIINMRRYMYANRLQTVSHTTSTQSVSLICLYSVSNTPISDIYVRFFRSSIEILKQ